MDRQDQLFCSSVIPEWISLAGADVNKSTITGVTRLHLFVQRQDLEITTDLLNAGANVNVKDAFGNTPLSLAITNGSSSMVELLLRYNPDFDVGVRGLFYYLLTLEATEFTKIVKAMINSGFTTQESDIVTLDHVWGAVTKGLADLVISFVKFNTDVLKWIRNWYISLSLHMQPFDLNLSEIFETLKKISDHFTEGSVIEITNNRNRNLFRILLSDDWTYLKKINILYRLGKCNFIHNDSIDLDISMNVLLCCYDSENPICDNFGRTGLHYAAKVGSSYVIEALLKIHLNIYQSDVRGKTALDYIYKKIKDQEHDKHYNFHLHYDTQFACYYAIADFKMSALILLQHLFKIGCVTSYIKAKHERTAKKLLNILKEDGVYISYYNSLNLLLKKYEDEIAIMKNEKLGELSYFDFISKSDSQLARYTKREEVIKVFQMNDDILKKFEIYGPILKHRFHSSHLRVGFLEAAEIRIFEMMKCYQIPIEIVRKILDNLNNDELYAILPL